MEAPNKRLRLDDGLSVNDSTSITDLDDFYDAPTTASTANSSADLKKNIALTNSLSNVQLTSKSRQIPGLSLLQNTDCAAPRQAGTLHGSTEHVDGPSSSGKNATNTIDSEDAHTLAPPLEECISADSAPSAMRMPEAQALQANGDMPQPGTVNFPVAEEQVEYEFGDSSESSDDSTSDSTSSSESDDFPLLTAEEQVKILMRGEFGDFADNDKSGNPRTANEISEESLEIPSITITPDMKIVDLGDVSGIFDTSILVDSISSGDYQVLEPGSVICLGDRTFVGAISETLGRVQKPMYSVAFSSSKMVEKLGMAVGRRLYYVDSLASFVFTKMLHATRGTDASNQHDEEPNPNELEFSDDEAEAEYKRRLKRDKRNTREPTMSQPPSTNSAMIPKGHASVGRRPPPSTEREDDDMYTPLARPDNLHLMSQGNFPTEKPPSTRNDRPGRKFAGGKKGQHWRGAKMNENVGSNAPVPSNGGSSQPNISNQNIQITGRLPDEATKPNLAELHSNTNPYGFHQAQATGITLPSFTGNIFPASTVQQPTNIPGPAFQSGSDLPPGTYINPAFFATRPNDFSNPDMRIPTSQPSYYGQQSPSLTAYDRDATSPGWRSTATAAGVGQEPSSYMIPSSRSPDSDAAFRAAQEQLQILRNLSRQPY